VELLVGRVDTELLEAVRLEHLEPEHVQHPDLQQPVQIRACHHPFSNE